MIYGAAGTGKTYLINHVSQFFDTHSKLFLANTNPAVENLRRKVFAQNCDFMTIRKYIMSKNVPTDIDILIMDECSMVSNADMAAVLRKLNCKIMLLVGIHIRLNLLLLVIGFQWQSTLFHNMHGMN